MMIRWSLVWHLFALGLAAAGLGYAAADIVVGTARWFAPMLTVLALLAFGLAQLHRRLAKLEGALDGVGLRAHADQRKGAG